MKKRHARDIPDFSRKSPPAAGTPSLREAAKPNGPAPRPVAVNVKPQATSAKAGRRGQ